MKAYNQKIIDPPTYLEIYDYEVIITPKQKTNKNENTNTIKYMRFEIA